MKKTLSFLLSVLLMFSVISPAFSCYAKSGLVSAKNPYYSGAKINDLSNYTKERAASTYSDTREYYVYNDAKYYVECDTLYKKIRNALAKHSETVNIKFYSKYPLTRIGTNNLLLSLFANSTDDRLSVSSTDGDYARWGVTNLSLSYEMYNNSNGNYYDISLKYYYYQTLEQERSVSQKINTVVKAIRAKEMNDYNTVKYVHDYICNLGSYDYGGASLGGEYDITTYSPYGLMFNGKGVCQSYALLFYRICKELGYNVRFVSSDPYSGCHAWNLIMLDDKYYYVDTTWDDEIRDGGIDPTEFNNNKYYYFLVDYETLQSKDDNYQHVLYDEEYANSYFENNYASKISDSSYKLSASKGFSRLSIKLPKYVYAAYGGALTPKVTVTDLKGNTVSDYTASYSSNVNYGIGFVNIKGKGIYEGYTARRTFLIVPAKKSAPSTKSGSRKTTSLTLEWSPAKISVKGYEIQMYKNGAWRTVKTTRYGTTTSYTVTNLSPSTTYSFRIRSFTEYNNCNHYGEYSNVFKSSTIPNTVGTPSLSTNSKSITVKWSKVKCSGYQIRYSRNSSMSNSKTVKADSSATSKKISSLLKGRRYYVQIRAYKLHTTANGKQYTYYSAWSDKKSIIVK